MSIFIQVEQTVSDYNVLWTVFRSSAQAAADVTAAVAARIAADRAQADERAATLTAQSRDMTRPEVVRKLAQQELDRLQERTFDTLGNGTLDDELARRRLASEQRAFDLLGKTGLSVGRV